MKNAVIRCKDLDRRCLDSHTLGAGRCRIRSKFANVKRANALVILNDQRSSAHYEIQQSLVVVLDVGTHVVGSDAGDNRIVYVKIARRQVGRADGFHVDAELAQCLWDVIARSNYIADPEVGRRGDPYRADPLYRGLVVIKGSQVIPPNSGVAF